MPTFIQKHKRLQIVEEILNSEKKDIYSTTPDFKRNDRTAFMKTAWFWHKIHRKINGTEKKFRK